MVSQSQPQQITRPSARSEFTIPKIVITCDDGTEFEAEKATANFPVLLGLFTLRLGPVEKTEDLTIRKELVIHRSDYFRGILKFGELVDFSNEDPDIVKTYVQLLLCGVDEVRNLWVNKDNLDALTMIAKIYILADFLVDEETKNLMVRELVRVSNSQVFLEGMAAHRANKYQNMPGPDVVMMVYKNTSASDKACRFLIDLFTYHADTSNATEILNTDWQSLPEGFATALMQNLLRNRQPMAEHEAELKEHKLQVNTLKNKVLSANGQMARELILAGMDHEDLIDARTKISDHTATIEQLNTKITELQLELNKAK